VSLILTALSLPLSVDDLGYVGATGMLLAAVVAAVWVVVAKAADRSGDLRRGLQKSRADTARAKQ
jgi:hypothetical protein